MECLSLIMTVWDVKIYIFSEMLLEISSCSYNSNSLPNQARLDWLKGVLFGNLFLSINNQSRLFKAQIRRQHRGV